MASKQYECYWSNSAGAAENYICFCRVMKNFCEYLEGKKFKKETSKPLLKIIDEYNYATITKKWV